MKNLIKEFDGIKTCALLTHLSIDGDTLCSCLALKELFKEKGIKADVITEDEIPHNLLFLDGDITPYSAKQDYSYDMAIAVDCASQDRLSEREKIFLAAKKRVVIDHHVTNTGFGDYSFIEPKAAAVCEIVYRLFKMMDIKISEYAAQLIYTGIATDTGSFRYSNTTPETMKTAADLLMLGVDNAYICSKIFDTKSLPELKIEAMAVENAVFYHDGKTVFVYITQEMAEKTGASETETAGISSVLKSIAGVETAAVLKQHGDCLKLSMRSKNIVDVARICMEIGGGGHNKAAGATICGMTAEEVMSFLEKRIEEEYGRSNKCV